MQRETGNNNAQPDFGTMNHHDFAAMVLYVDPTEHNSTKAMQHAGRDVHVQDIRDLPRPLPPWLNGIPTLVNKSDRRAYRGTACLDMLATHAQGAWASASGITGNMGGFASGEPVACGATSSFLAPVTPGGHALEARVEVAPETERVDQADVEAYMRRRDEPT